MENKSFVSLEEREQEMVDVIYSLIYPHIIELQKNEMNIFLIGARLSDKLSMRYRIFQSLFQTKGMNIYFPEYIFEELSAKKESDLLSLENMLAESVHAVVMCIESAGSFTELGAFSNHVLLKDRLIVYIESKYKRSNSFIRVGPIRYLDQKTSSKIVWQDFNEFDHDDRQQLISHIREIKKTSTVQYTLKNPIFVERFLLSVLYVFGSISRKTIIRIIKNLQITAVDDTEQIITIVDSSLSSLLRSKAITFGYPEYMLTTIGSEKLRRELTSKFIHRNLDKIRIQMINFKLRKYWG